MRAECRTTRCRGPHWLLAFWLLATCGAWGPAVLLSSAIAQAAERPSLKGEVTARLAEAGDNRPELERALAEAPDADEHYGLEFLIAHMPTSDLRSLKADYLLKNSKLAWKSRRELPWGRAIPEPIFLNNVLPYANIDEKRDDWRQSMLDLCLPIVKECQTPAEAAHQLNVEIFPKLNLKYSTQRRAANQGPAESIESGKASCTGLSIVLADACRAVCIPARLVGTPLWSNKRGNHTWVEIWDQTWHFTGACEPDKQGLNRGWFIGDASQAQEDSFEHAIYAASFARTERHFPLPWAMRDKSVPAENVTARYAAKAKPAKATVRLLVRVYDAQGQRAIRGVAIAKPAADRPLFSGRSRGEMADLNDILGFEVEPGSEFVVRVGEIEQRVSCPADRPETIVDVRLP